MNGTNEHNIKENALKRKEMRYKSIIKWLETMEPFTDENNIPSVPRMENEEDYKRYVISNYIRCGAIPKSKLKIGETYLGDCRNASTAVWNGNVFVYKRRKFNLEFDEEINHFEDDNGFDLFVPLKLVEKNPEITL